MILGRLARRTVQLVAPGVGLLLVLGVVPAHASQVPPSAAIAVASGDSLPDPSPSPEAERPAEIDSGPVIRPEPAPGRTLAAADQLAVMDGPVPGSVGPVDMSGTYDVVVAALGTPAGPSPATEANSPAVVEAADRQYAVSTQGAVKLSLRQFVGGVTSPGLVCGVGAAYDAVKASVLSALGGSAAPRPGSVGTLVVVVTADQTSSSASCATYAGQGWLGAGGQHIDGHWTPGTAHVLAHETGHNLGLMHANAMLCSGAAGFPQLQRPSWPCTGHEYSETTSFMGLGWSAEEIGLGYLSAEHRMQLGLPIPGGTVDLSAGGEVSLAGLYTDAVGPRAAILTASSTRFTLEYRPATGVEARLDDSDRKGMYTGGSGVYLRASPGSATVVAGGGNAGTYAYSSGFAPSARPQLAQLGMPVGTRVPLPDGTVVAVVSADGTTATVRVTRPTPGATAPSPPTRVAAVPSPSGVVVTWDAPSSDGGGPLLGYTVTSSPGGLTCSTSGQDSCVVANLVDGTTYTFTVTATNAIGSSTASDPSAPVTAMSRPGRPGTPSAVAGDASAVVTWTAPASTGGASSLGYTVTAAPGGARCDTSSLTCTITGLANGTAYRFSVISSNTVGSSEAAGPSAAVTPRSPPIPPSAPTAPGAPTVWMSTGGALLIWTSPANEGGTPVTSYEATATPGGATCQNNGASRSCAINGLTPGTFYTFQVVAINAVGRSPASDASSPASPVTRASAPRNLVATAGDGSVTLTWEAPELDGYTPITGYRVSSSPAVTIAETTGQSVTIAGLANGTWYMFAVAAVNQLGPGLRSQWSPWVTPTAADQGRPTSGVGQVTPGTDRVTTTPARAVLASPRSKRVRVDVNPDQLPASTHGTQWKFDLQRRSHTGKWKTVKKRVQTKGASHIRTLKVKPGVYRVVVRPAFGYPTATSATIAVAK